MRQPIAAALTLAFVAACAAPEPPEFRYPTHAEIEAVVPEILLGPDPGSCLLSTLANSGFPVFAVSDDLVMLLASRVCSPEHCWSETSLRWYDRATREVLREIPVTELGYGHLVRAACWVPEGGGFFRARVGFSHGGEEPEYIVRVTLSGPIGYSIARE